MDYFNRSPATLSQSVATTPGTTYAIGFYVAAHFLASPVTLTVTFGGTTIFSHLFTTSTNYTGYTFNATALASSANLNFSVTGASELFLDDISVKPTGVGVPDGGTTVPLLGCALLCLAGLRRKLSC